MIQIPLIIAMEIRTFKSLITQKQTPQLGKYPKDTMLYHLQFCVIYLLDKWATYQNILYVFLYKLKDFVNLADLICRLYK